mgnify:CR=1 FL=1
MAVGAPTVGACEQHFPRSDCIDDSAPAVPVDLLDRLGERFFRVESSRNRQLGGTGLGLALSRHIVEAHDGRLVFAESPLGGLRAILVLPLES